MTPEDLLMNLKSNSSLRIHRSLDAIYEICKEQQNRGIRDFSVSTIATLGFNRGVPKAQSIRNKTGEKYRALIQCFADSLQTTKLTKPSLTDNAWIEEIQNPKHQLLVRIMASELKEAHQMIREIIVPPKQRIDIYGHKNMIPDQAFKFSDQEVRALQYLLSTDFQKNGI